MASGAGPRWFGAQAGGDVRCRFVRNRTCGAAIVTANCAGPTRGEDLYRSTSCRHEGPRRSGNVSVVGTLCPI